MSTTEITAPTGHVSQGEQDLGPLAWVLEELRKSLDAAVKATRRFVREAEEVRDSDLAALDSSPLRIAKQQLHQSCGALEMVGMPQPALLLRAMETALQHYVQNPSDCTDAVAQTLEKASFALLEFLEAVLAGQHISAVALFPQYRDVQALYGNQGKVHPADLWPIERRLRDPALPVQVAPLSYSAEQRKVLDAAVLQIVKGVDIAPASTRLRDVCLGYAQAQSEPNMRTFWKVAAAYFDALAHGLLNVDIYTKRVASRVLMVSAALAKGGPVAPERLLQDMLFFCAQAASDSPAAQAAVVWKAVYASFGLQRHVAVDYEHVRFGRFDPALLAQARKRIATATEIWSSLAGGDVHKIKPAVDQFTLVTDSLTKLHPQSEALGQALMQVVHSVAARGQPPSAEVAMEVATAVLYLQAAFASLELADEAMSAHGQTLAQRLTSVLGGAAAQPLEPWMEHLYRQVSDQQTMGSVVGELRVTLGEAEKLLDQYFRNPADTTVLGPVTGHLSQMRGVLSVLGLDQASLAMVRMRQNVEHLLNQEVPSAEQPALFEKMANSLGALGFLIDMLSYQRNLARKLYEFDEAEGELKLRMGRARVRASDGAAKPADEVLQSRVEQIVQPTILPRPAQVAAPSEAPAVALAPEAAHGQAQPPEPELAERERPLPAAPEVPPLAPPAAAPVLQLAQEDTDSELLGIFLEEAREVVAHGRAALQVLAQEPANLSEQTVLRRAFHTLKGSSRMVGLDDFGQAGWAMEQMLNAWLAEQKAMPKPMQQLSLQALNGFEAWANAIEAEAAQAWQSAPFRASADAMRLDARFIPLDMAAVQGQAASDVADPIAALHDAQMLAADALSVAEEPIAQEVQAAQEVQDVQEVQDLDSAALDALFAPQVTPVTALSDDALTLLPEMDLSDWAQAQLALPAAELPAETVAPVEAAQEISFDEFNAVLKAAGDGISAPLLPPADESLADLAAAPMTPDVSQNAPFQATDGALAVQSATAAGDEAADADAPGEADAGQPLLAKPTPLQDADIKRIGSLSVPLPLFNVFLTEAEAWSSHLLDALTAWQENLDEPQPEMVHAWAHSLAGSSSTVGFTALSGLARQLEHALLHVTPQPQGVAAQVRSFVQAAEEIRSLLHQFAAGFLHSASQSIQDQLKRIVEGDLVLQAAAVPDAAPPDAAPSAAAQPAVALQDTPALHHDIDVAMANAMILGGAQDDDIDAFDVIDPDLFPIFEEEAAELLPTLGTALREWATHPTKLEARATLLRALHTLKGSARLAGAMRMGEMAHRLESALETLDVDTVTTEQIEPLFARLDAIDADFNALRAVDAQAAATPLHAEPLHGEPADAPELASPPAQPLAPAQAASDGAVQAVPSLAPAPRVGTPAAPPLVVGGMRPITQQTVRVRSQLLDRLINEAGEVMIARSRLDERMGSIKHSLADLGSNLTKLRQQLRDVEVQAESQMQSRMQLFKEAGADFDPLEFDRFTRVQELTRMMAESVNDVATVQRNLHRDVEGAEDDLIAQGRQARELQRDLLRTRMVEFDSISERLYAVVRMTSKETGKQVKLDLSGGTIEMDRGVLERMVPAFEHLLRNCVDHGIEMPDQRQAAGKSASGMITVRVQQDGNDVAVAFEDDGAGLNVARIREKALALGWIAADEQVDAARAAELVFMPGFSTAEQLTDVSGRGIGMDVVRSEVLALGGRIETHSEAGRGACFRLVLPLTTAVTQVVMLRAGDFSVGVPASLVEVVRRVSLADLEAAYRSGALVEGDAHIPFYWAGAVWSHSARSADTGHGKTRPVVIFRSASQRIALHVDEVLGHQEVVVKNLGPQMARLPGLTGMSVLASGAVVLIYNPVALTAVYGDTIAQVGQGLPALLSVQQAQDAQRQAGLLLPATGTGSASQVPLVLVVDDSITVRRVSQRLLQREGYRVVTAADGLQALQKLQDEVPCVVLSDIEMPRMDGFDLLRHIRAQDALKQLPIIMITSRMAQKHRDHAMELGASHYLGKPYSDEELMGLVHHYAVGQPLPVAAVAAAAAGAVVTAVAQAEGVPPAV